MNHVRRNIVVVVTVLALCTAGLWAADKARKRGGRKPRQEKSRAGGVVHVVQFKHIPAESFMEILEQLHRRGPGKELANSISVAINEHSNSIVILAEGELAEIVMAIADQVDRPSEFRREFEERHREVEQRERHMRMEMMERQMKFRGPMPMGGCPMRAAKAGGCKGKAGGCKGRGAKGCAGKRPQGPMGGCPMRGSMSPRGPKPGCPMGGPGMGGFRGKGRGAKNCGGKVGGCKGAAKGPKGPCQGKGKAGGPCAKGEKSDSFADRKGRYERIADKEAHRYDDKDDDD